MCDTYMIMGLDKYFHAHNQEIPEEFRHTTDKISGLSIIRDYCKLAKHVFHFIANE